MPYASLHDFIFGRSNRTDKRRPNALRLWTAIALLGCLPGVTAVAQNQPASTLRTWSGLGGGDVVSLMLISE